MPNVAETIKDHVTLEARCIDRLYRNAYIPRLQSGGGVTALDNGFLHCATPAVVRAVCDALDAAPVERFFARWHQQIPFPLAAAQAAKCFAYQLSILQAEVSLTQVLDRPLRGGEFFETGLPRQS